MERTLGLRPWLGLCVLAVAPALSGCGSTTLGGPALASDAAPVSVDAASPTVDAALTPGDFCERGGAPCPAGSSCRQPSPWPYAHCVVDGAEWGACRATSSACDPGLGCDGAAPAGECRRLSTPVDAGAPTPPDGGTPGPCNRYVRESCPWNSLCLPRMGALTCVAYGSVGGPCWPDNRCDPGAQCNAPTGTCVTPAALGAECDTYVAPCEAGTTCRYPLDEARTRCLAIGSLGGECRTTGAPCDAGLACARTGYGSSRCLPIIAVGEGCDRNAVRNTCSEGASCLDVTGGSRCLAIGAEMGACRTEGDPCGPGLLCSDARCRRALAIGDACDSSVTAGVCPADSDCAGPVGSSRCVARGAAGAQCRSASPACDANLECLSLDGYEPGRCHRIVAEGDPCDVAQRVTRCAGSMTCAPDLTGVNGVCARPGTVAGAPCRLSSPRCDGMLECSFESATYQQTCRRIEPAGAPCDLATRTVVCAGDARCVPLDGAGVCTVDTPEVEPNDDAATAQAMMGNPVVIAGALDGGRRDCFAVTTQANASMRVVAWPESYTDRLPMEVTLLDDAGDAAATAAGGSAPTLDPALVPAARGLRAGRHVVCIGSSGPSGSRYRLTIAVTIPTP